MSSEQRINLEYKKQQLEKTKNGWEIKIIKFEEELLITSSMEKNIELEARIKKCKEKISYFQKQIEDIEKEIQAIIDDSEDGYKPRASDTPPSKLKFPLKFVIGIAGIIIASVVILDKVNQPGNPTFTPTSTPTISNNPPSVPPSIPENIYRHPNGLFEISLPNGYEYTEKENGIVFNSPDEGFIGNIILFEVDHRLTRRKQEELLKQTYEQILDGVSWQESNLLPDGSLRVDWLGRDNDGNDLDGVSYTEQHNNTIFILNFYGFNKPLNDYTVEARSILKNYRVRR